MRRLIKYFNVHGTKTVSSCCGHGKYPITIVVMEDDGMVYELLSGKMLYNKDASNYRQRNFYNRDKQGYFYIPETI